MLNNLSKFSKIFLKKVLAQEENTAERIIRAFLEIDNRTGKNNYVLLHDLREALPDIDRDEFNDAINSLRMQRILSLDAADGRHKRLSAEEVKSGIPEEGQVLVYATLIQKNEDDEFFIGKKEEEIEDNADYKDLNERIVEEFEKIDAKSGGFNYVLLHDLRQALSDVGDEEFYKAIYDLRVQRKISLDAAEGRHQRLTQEQLDAGVPEEGQTLVYVSLRK